MAKFEIDDWVKIIPDPDLKSDFWTDSHNKFCSKIGQITDINREYDDIILLRVVVEFNRQKRTAWFEDKHVIKTSKWESDRIIYLNEKWEEYKKFEKTVKRKRDEILKQVFSDPYEEYREARKAMDEIMQQEERNMQGWLFGDDWYMTDCMDDSDNS